MKNTTNSTQKSSVSRSESANSSATTTKSPAKTRRRYSDEQKIAILREHLIESKPISEVCERHEIYPKMFYDWQKCLFENGAEALKASRSRSQTVSKDSKKLSQLEDRVKQKNAVIAELTEENMRLKKPNGAI